MQPEDKNTNGAWLSFSFLFAILNTSIFLYPTELLRQGGGWWRVIKTNGLGGLFGPIVSGEGDYTSVWLTTYFVYFVAYLTLILILVAYSNSREGGLKRFFMAMFPLVIGPIVVALVLGMLGAWINIIPIIYIGISTILVAGVSALLLKIIPIYRLQGVLALVTTIILLGLSVGLFFANYQDSILRPLSISSFNDGGNGVLTSGVSNRLDYLKSLNPDAFCGKVFSPIKADICAETFKVLQGEAELNLFNNIAANEQQESCDLIDNIGSIIKNGRGYDGTLLDIKARCLGRTAKSPDDCERARRWPGSSDSNKDMIKCYTDFAIKLRDVTICDKLFAPDLRNDQYRKNCISEVNHLPSI